MRTFRCALLVLLLALPAYAHVQLTVQPMANDVLFGTATPNAAIEVTGSLQGRTYADAYGRWSIRFDTSRLITGQVVQLRVVARDYYGRVSQPVDLQFALNRPVQTALNVTSPTCGAVLNGNFMLTGTAAPGSLIEVTGDREARVYADAAGNWCIPLTTGRARHDRELKLKVRATSPVGARSAPVHLRYALAVHPGAASNLHLRVKSPGNGADIYRRLVLMGSATPGATVEVSGDLSGRVVADANGRWTLPLSLYRFRDKELDLRVIARDAAGNRSAPVRLEYDVRRTFGNDRRGWGRDDD